MKVTRREKAKKPKGDGPRHVYEIEKPFVVLPMHGERSAAVHVYCKDRKKADAEARKQVASGVASSAVIIKLSIAGVTEVAL